MVMNILSYFVTVNADERSNLFHPPLIIYILFNFFLHWNASTVQLVHNCYKFSHFSLNVVQQQDFYSIFIELWLDRVSLMYSNLGVFYNIIDVHWRIKKKKVANKKMMTKEQPTVLSLTHLDIVTIFGLLLLSRIKSLTRYA